jgi:hypothetical protein
MLKRLSTILILSLLFACISCSTEKNKNEGPIKSNKSEEKKFLKVIESNSKIRSTPDLEGAVIERAKQDMVLEYLKDSTSFTSTVRFNGKDVESRWYKVKTLSGNEGWISGICVLFFSDEENNQINSMNEDQATNNNTSTKSKVQAQSKIDSASLKNFKSRLNAISTNDPLAFQNAVSLFEASFQEKASATADIAFAALMTYHENVFLSWQNKINPAAYNHLANEIKNYGSANLDYDATSKALSANYLDFGLKKNGKVYLRRNYDQLMRKFLRLLTVAMQIYLEQSALESQYPALEDGEINIPLTEIAAYAVFWDKYLSRYPNSAVSLEAKQLRKKYSALLLEGKGKMPAFQDKKLQAQFKNAYLAMTTQMGVSPLIKSFKAYYELLKNEKFKENNKTKEFASSILSGL